MTHVRNYLKIFVVCFNRFFIFLASFAFCTKAVSNIQLSISLSHSRMKLPELLKLNYPMLKYMYALWSDIEDIYSVDETWYTHQDLPWKNSETNFSSSLLLRDYWFSIYNSWSLTTWFAFPAISLMHYTSNAKIYFTEEDNGY